MSCDGVGLEVEADPWRFGEKRLPVFDPERRIHERLEVVDVLLEREVLDTETVVDG